MDLLLLKLYMQYALQSQYIRAYCFRKKWTTVICFSSDKVDMNIFYPAMNKCENYVSPYLFSDTFYHPICRLQVTYGTYYLAHKGRPVRWSNILYIFCLFITGRPVIVNFTFDRPALAFTIRYCKGHGLKQVVCVCPDKECNHLPSCSLNF